MDSAALHQPDKIQNITTGSSLPEVNDVLGIQPYDILHHNGDGNSLLVYNYRYKLKEMEYPGDKSDRKHNVESQTKGEPYYDGEFKLYTLFQNNKLASLVTDNGLQESEAILLTNNTIQLVSQKDIDWCYREKETWCTGGDNDNAVPVGLLIYLNKHNRSSHPEKSNRRFRFRK